MQHFLLPHLADCELEKINLEKYIWCAYKFHFIDVKRVRKKNVTRFWRLSKGKAGELLSRG